MLGKQLWDGLGQALSRTVIQQAFILLATLGSGVATAIIGFMEGGFPMTLVVCLAILTPLVVFALLANAFYHWSAWSMLTNDEYKLMVGAPEFQNCKLVNHENKPAVVAMIGLGNAAKFPLRAKLTACKFYLEHEDGSDRREMVGGERGASGELTVQPGVPSGVTSSELILESFYKKGKVRGVLKATIAYGKHELKHEVERNYEVFGTLQSYGVWLFEARFRDE